MKIAIVVDMRLKGFDVHSLATTYVYKPMSNHNLMQAIAPCKPCIFKDKKVRPCSGLCGHRPRAKRSDKQL